jgi:hypothetical protein
MGERLGVNAGHADARTPHARDVVDDDLHSRSEVNGTNVWPTLGKELAYKPPMAVLGSGLAAEQGGPVFKIVRRQDLVNSSPLHQGEEVGLVGGPFPLALLVRIQEFLGWREQWLMLIRCADQFPQEIREVLGFGEPCQLRAVVEAHVHQALDVGVG